VPDVEALVALKADQIRAERGGGRAGQRCLADACFALEKQRPFEAQRQKDRDREAAIGDVLVIG